MKEDLWDHPFDSNEEVERTVRTSIQKQNVEFLYDGFKKLWQNCLENGSQC
jgi:hypothetical protein